jgi:hypothetical protein
VEGITEAALEVSFAIWNSQKGEMCMERLGHSTNIFPNVQWTASDSLIGLFMADMPFFHPFLYFYEENSIVVL